MASSSTADTKATWHEGDRCVVPSPKDGTLREATIQRLFSTSHSDITTALVRYSENDVEEEAVPVSELQRPGSNHFTQEKPLLHSSFSPAGASVPLVLSQSGTGEEKVPYTINRYLRDYQREGIRFIYDNYSRSRGCILGDDMGLGKTIQVIGFLAAVLHKTGTWEDIENNRPQFLLTQMPSKHSRTNKVFLIVAPLSVLYNWKDELDTWGHFQCVVVHGLRKEEELARIRKGRSEIALTTYETLRLCLDQFNSIDWSAVIVDEAHKIKNPNSQITQAMRDLRCQVRVGLTGTILQNNLDELWCVMDWAVPGCLGSLGHFKKEFSDPIEQGQRHSVTKRTLATGRKAVRALARKISHWFLRRTKAVIKEQLPKKDDRVVYCSLTDFQQTVYQTVLDSEDVTLLLRSSEKCECQSGRTRRRCCYKTNSEGVEMKELYFSYLAILRKVANHAALLQSTTGTSSKQKKYVGAICEKVFQKFPDFVQRCKQEAFEAMSDPMYSGKMKVLQKLLKYYIQRKDKVLLFSLSTKLLNVLESYCMAEGLDYSRLDGTTKSRERVKIVKEFNSCPHINLCLVSTMAGGLGLNFVGANVVVLFDPTWNPANDLQAIDRAYRIGQCRDVTVLRLISLGTVEEVIYLRQVYKQQLQCSVMGRESARRYFEAVQGADGQKGELFGIKNLFRLQTQGTCLTRKILEREGRVEAGLMTTSTHTGEEKEEEERKKASDNGDPPPPIDAPKLNNEPSKVTGVGSHIPRGGVLDFSSEDEEADGRGAKRKASEPPAVDGSGGGCSTTASTPDRLSLLQHGFSRLLQGSGVKSGPGGSSQSEAESGEGSDSLEEGRDGEPGTSGKKENTSSRVLRSPSTAGSGGIQTPKSRMNNWDISIGSGREDGGGGGREKGKERLSVSEESDDIGRDKPGMKEGMASRGKEVEEESDRDSGSDRGGVNKTRTTVPRVHQCYSDESEDLDIEVVTRPRIEALNPRRRWTGRDRGRGDSGSIRKRQTISGRNQARSKHSENIETFTSSDEEHTPVKRGRPEGGHFTTPQTGRPGATGQTDRQGQTGQADGHKATGKTDGECTERRRDRPKAVSFTGLKTQLSPAAKGTEVGTIDNVLGGVLEVVYTHSNQRVVGGSRAEERISRAALRDVFDRKMYSQLPANHLLGTQESLSESSPDTPPRPAAGGAELAATTRPSVDHPVTFTTNAVHHTRHTTFIIGQTPGAIRRQHLEEMAAELGSSSVRQFAEEVLRSSSAQRLSWLRQYYTSLDHPELAETVKNNFPEPDSARPRAERPPPPPSTPPPPTTTSSSATTPKRTTKRTYRKTGSESDADAKRTPQKSVLKPQKEQRTSYRNVLEPQKEQRTSYRNVLEPQSEVLIPEEVEEQDERVCDARGEKRKTIDCISSSGDSRAAATGGDGSGGGSGSSRISSRISSSGGGVRVGSGQGSSSGLGPREAAALPDHRDKDTPSSPGLNHDWLTAPSKPPAQGEQRSSPRTSVAARGHRDDPEDAPSTPNHRSRLTELIGDVSILDDLFRTKPRGAQQRGSPKTPPNPGGSASTIASRASASPSGAAANTPPSRPNTTALAHSLSSPRSSHAPSTEPVHTPPTQRSKSSRKDFWDILNEGNEESINRLTDLSEVERVCVSTNRTARTRGEESESPKLWKTNEKFLWRR